MRSKESWKCPGRLGSRRASRFGCRVGFVVDLMQLFPGSSEAIYLDTASMALGNQPSAVALLRAVNEWQAGTFDWKRAEARAEDLRASVARLLGTGPENLALVTGASGGAGTVASQLPLDGAGRNVVVPGHDYSSNFLPWMQLQEHGYELRTIDEVDGVLSPESFAGAVDADTVVIATSLVHSASGFRVDLDALKDIAASNGAWLVVDASQALGSVRIDIDGIHALFSCSHKWLLGVRGIGHLYVAPELRDGFRPITPGWKATVEPAAGFYGPNLHLASSASKLDASSPWFDAIANAEGVAIIEEVGIGVIEQHNYSLVHYLVEAGIAVPFEPRNQSPIVSLNLRNPDKAMASLKAHNIKAAVRAGRLRVAMHLYNSIDDMDALIESLA